MFNRIVRHNGDVVLYNSRTGTLGIRKVSAESEQHVGDLLSSAVVKVESETEDTVIQRLIEGNYLVPIECNEKHIRTFIQNTFLCDSSLTIVVHLTQNCNFRCTYCYMDHKAVSIYPETQTGIVNFVRRNISQYKSVTVSWFGGEPTLEMGVIERLSKELIEICRKANKPYNGVITTNGYLLTPKNIDILLRSRVTTICVTIDGLKDVHDIQRVLANGSPTFERIISNLLYIRDNIKRRIPEVILRTNITKSHQKMLSDYCKFFDDLFGSDSRFSLFIRPVADYGGTRVQALSPDFISDMSEVYEKIADIDSKIEFNLNYQDLNVGGSTCKSKGHSKFTIGCDGSVHKCDESLDYPLGHLYKSGKMDINLPTYAKWLSGYRSNECDECFFSLCCFMEGCPKTRVFNNEVLPCHINFHEIDTLIWCYSKKHSCEEI